MVPLWCRATDARPLWEQTFPTLKTKASHPHRIVRWDRRTVRACIAFSHDRSGLTAWRAWVTTMQSIASTARSATGNATPYNPTGNRTPDDYSVVRIIACRIAWLTQARRWTHHPEQRGLFLRREEAFELAQMTRGLLVIGSGLVDLEDTNAA